MLGAKPPKEGLGQQTLLRDRFIRASECLGRSWEHQVRVIPRKYASDGHMVRGPGLRYNAVSGVPVLPQCQEKRCVLARDITRIIT